MPEQPPELFGHLTEKPGFAARPETGHRPRRGAPVLMLYHATNALDPRNIKIKLGETTWRFTYFLEDMSRSSSFCSAAGPFHYKLFELLSVLLDEFLELLFVRVPGHFFQELSVLLSRQVVRFRELVEMSQL